MKRVNMISSAIKLQNIVGISVTLNHYEKTNI